MKVAGAYDSVTLGVSEQVAHIRRSGQMAEQINLISDPVHGLVRRRGSIWQDESAVSLAYGTIVADACQMREFTFNIAGIEYSLLYRAHASANGKPGFAFAFNKATSKFMPIVYENSTFLDQLVSGGVSAITCAGAYLYIAGNSNIPTYTQVDNWSVLSNTRYLAAWVRGGAYDRTFKVSVTKADGTIVVGSYHTVSSAYPGTLDTSDIQMYTDPPANTHLNPTYQKEVNDRVNAYNSAAALWIGSSAADIVPQNIAQKIADDLTLQGVNAFTSAATPGTICIDDVDCVELSVDDGGDGTLMRGAGKEVTSPEMMTLCHFAGKVVRVTPQGSTAAESYYLVAYPQDGQSVGWTQVVWQEGAGVVTAPAEMVTQGYITGGTLYLAKDGAGLTALCGGDHPSYAASTVGDGVSSPLPEFFGKVITMLAMFQDRLVVGSGGTVNCSVSGDYLNFFRATVLQIKDTDPIEMYSYGSEGDTLRFTTMFDKSLIIFGDLQQYAISGQTVLTPQQPLIVTISAHENSTSTAPVSSGNFVFYTKYAEGRSSLHQLQIGQLIQTPVSYEVSQQLDTYIKGPPAQLYALTAPNIIFYRTDTSSDTFYIYQYLDDQGGGNRLYDSWSRWKFASVLGTVCGVSSFQGEVLVYSLRAAGGRCYIVADKINLTNDTSDKPYMDSLKPYTGLNGWHAQADAAQFSAAVDSTSTYFLLGTNLGDVATLIAQLPGVQPAVWVGAVEAGFVQPTNPYYKTFTPGVGYKTVLAGRLTLGNVQPTVLNSGALIGAVQTVNGNDTNLQFQGRLLGRSTNIIAQQPLITGTLAPMAVGREVRECSYTFTSDTWLPMNITAIEWVGQYFNRTRRA